MSYTNPIFAEMRNTMNKYFEDDMATKFLMKTDCDADELWELYLDSFPEEIKKPWRERAWHDCQACKRWFKKMSNVVALSSDYKIYTMFGCFNDIPVEYKEVFSTLNSFILENGNVRDIFLSTDKKIGHEKNFEEGENGKVIQHDHFFSILPDKVIRQGVKVGQDMAKARTNKDVLKSSLDSISLYSVELVLELIEDNNLYRGKEWKGSLEVFKNLRQEYDTISAANRNNWLWVNSLKVGESISRIKNHSIGVLLIDLTKHIPLETALKRYENVVAPANYKRPKAIFTKKMLEDAQKKIVELGYGDSLARRYAVIEDISVKDTIFVNRELSKGIKGKVDDLFGKLNKNAVVKRQNFNYATEMDLETFIKEKLPKASEVFLYTDEALTGNFVSLIAPVNEDAPSMFKWDNPFCWAYRNNVADSMKEQVKTMGGDVDVDFRFSIRWNNKDEWDKNDLDAHCVEPNKNVIYYNNKRDYETGGWLDVDIIDPEQGVPAVENIQFKDRTKMIPGDYYLRVNQFTYRGGDKGFEAEIEFDGKIFNFNYPHKVNQEEFIEVACLTVDANRNFTLTPNPDLLVDKTSTTMWNVKMNEFVPVRLMSYSPNYWGDNKVGNQHVFFMLQDCISEDTPNAWFNEYLNNELNENRQVMEALGHEAKVEVTDNQLSGMGFSVTKRNKITVKTIEGVEEKIYNLII